MMAATSVRSKPAAAGIDRSPGIPLRGSPAATQMQVPPRLLFKLVDGAGFLADDAQASPIPARVRRGEEKMTWFGKRR